MASKFYKEILIATDGKESTGNAVDYGIELAKNCGAKLYAVYVIDSAAYASIPMDEAWENMHGLLKEEGDAATQYVEDRAKAEYVKVERLTTEGHPAEEIIKYAEKCSVDLIVVGTSKKRGWNRFWLGSVAEKVVKKSKIPVLVVPINK